MLADFEGMPLGTVLPLYYNHLNEGCMLWRHERVEGTVVGSFYNAVNGQWTDPQAYLYEFDGHGKWGRSYVCCNTGAEPVWNIPNPPCSFLGEAFKL